MEHSDKSSCREKVLAIVEKTMGKLGSDYILNERKCAELGKTCDLIDEFFKTASKDADVFGFRERCRWSILTDLSCSGVVFQFKAGTFCFRGDCMAAFFAFTKRADYVRFSQGDNDDSLIDVVVTNLWERGRCSE